MAQEWIEVALFIHGITTQRQVKSHDACYQDMFDRIQAALQAKGKPLFDALPIKVEWGWDSKQSAENDRFLAQAESNLYGQVTAVEKNVSDFSIMRPLHSMARELIMLGFADLFYYVSKDGELAVRRNVFQSLCDQLNARKARSPKSKISVTLITHSAGTIIAHDLLYHLFRKSVKKSEGGDAVRQVRQLVRTGQLRVRKLYTMGSPISPLIIRADSTMIKIVQGQKLKPEEIGLRASDNLPNPRWINFWDKDDLAAFPVEFLYDNQSQVIQDKYMDLGDFFPPVHSAYWTSDKVCDYIAETLWPAAP
jgi:hypothetical protein